MGKREFHRRVHHDLHDRGTEGRLPEDALSDPAAQGETATDVSEEDADTRDWELER